MSTSAIDSPGPTSSILPHIHFLCMETQAVTAFNTALQQYSRFSTNFCYTVHESSLSMLEDTINFDLVVSPANSYGRLDGSFDDAISRAFSPKEDYFALTLHVQAELYREYKGYLPPGHCHIVRMPEEWKGNDNVESKLRYGDGKGWGCKWIAMVPTMRVPMVLDGQPDIVYTCVWALLAAIERHNRDMGETEKIKSILMTPLGTGVGRVSYERWANQCLLAMKHFVDACEQPREWAQISWSKAELIDHQIEATM